MQNYSDSPRVVDIRSNESIIRANKVLRSTYMLLSMTLLFSAFTAFVSFSQQVAGEMPQMINPFLFIIVYLGLIFGIQATRNSPWGIVLTFALTGVLGWSLGPILSMYVTLFSNASQLIMMAFGSTGAIFFVLSIVSLNPRRNFNRIGSFCAVGALVVFVMIIISLFVHIQALYIAISVAMAIISSGFILWQTNAIARGEQTNYILATVNIYVSLFNLFLIMLQFFASVAGDRR